MDTKKCSKCGEVKNVSEFNKQSSNKDGLNYYCKECCNEISKVYRERIGKEEINRRTRQSRLDHLEECRAKQRNLTGEKKERRNASSRKWKKNNRAYCTMKELERCKRKMATDPIFKRKEELRHTLKNSFTTRGFKKGSRTHEILGCTWAEFETWIEYDFLHQGMTWDSYGFYGWHYDHIIPISTGMTEEEVTKLNHYTNFQPLWWYDNFEKSNKLLNNISL